MEPRKSHPLSVQVHNNQGKLCWQCLRALSCSAKNGLPQAQTNALAASLRQASGCCQRPPSHEGNGWQKPVGFRRLTSAEQGDPWARAHAQATTRQLAASGGLQTPPYEAHQLGKVPRQKRQLAKMLLRARQHTLWDPRSRAAHHHAMLAEQPPQGSSEEMMSQQARPQRKL